MKYFITGIAILLLDFLFCLIYEIIYEFYSWQSDARWYEYTVLGLLALGILFCIISIIVQDKENTNDIYNVDDMD